MENLSDKNYWDKEWEIETRKYQKFVFRELVEKFIPKGGTYFEVGCAPGSIMCYFSKVLGYRVSGIDYSSPEVIENYLKSNEVTDFKLYVDDFTTVEIKEKYDVVASYGFIEHFDKYKEIIQRHKELVNENGYLILELPNLRKFNWLIYKIVNPKLLNMHNLDIMNLKKLREGLGEGFEIKYLNYYKSSFLSFNDENAELDKNRALKVAFLSLKWLMEKLKLDNIPNRFFSPYIVLIARKHGSTEEK